MLPRSDSQALSALYGAFAAMALAMLVDQGSDLAIRLYPYTIAEVRWRFGAFGLAQAKMTEVVFADALLGAAMVGLGSRIGLRVWAALHLVAAAILAVALVVFGLDFLELRRAVRPEAKAGFTIAGVKAAVGSAVLAWLWIWAAVAGLQSTRFGAKRGGVTLVVTGPMRSTESAKSLPVESPRA